MIKRTGCLLASGKTEYWSSGAFKWGEFVCGAHSMTLAVESVKITSLPGKSTERETILLISGAAVSRGWAVAHTEMSKDPGS